MEPSATSTNANVQSVTGAAEPAAGAGSHEKTAYVSEGNNHKSVMEALQEWGFSILLFHVGYSGRFDLKLGGAAQEDRLSQVEMIPVRGAGG